MNNNQQPPQEPPTFSTGLFHGASQFTITQANLVENYWQQVIAGPSLDAVFDILKTGISIGAVHNSGERYDAPKCHPGTREKVLGEIMAWINSENPESRAMWLRGPAGAGKSAIAQTTAERCFEEGKLLGSFFFSRFDSERNISERLIPTIAYQLAMYVPEAKQHLLDVLRAEGPALLKLSLERQIQRLLLDPIRKVYTEIPTMTPKCVIIDGLDECQDPNKQAEIVRCVINAASTLATLGCPIPFLVVSRPELEIRQAFNKDKRSNKSIVLDLNEGYDPEKDIDWFLRAKFDEIKTDHPSRHRLYSNWPSNEQIKHIVQKSSGHFIYAATVIRYIQNIRSNPIRSLNEITEIPWAAGIDNPFAELDKLYSYILQVAVDLGSKQLQPKLISIFEALLYLRHTKFPDILDEFLDLGDTVEILLGDLYSIVLVPEDRERSEIKFLHASFGDFLRDERRSGNFFINEALAHFRLSNCCVKTLKKYVDNYSHDNTYPKAFYPSIREYFHHINKWLQLDSSMEITRSSQMPNDGIAIVCHAAIKSKYAAIGIRAKALGGRILGSFSQMIISGSDTSDGESNWIFGEMEKNTKVLSIGAYLELGAGAWNHVSIENPNPASLRFLHSHITTIFETPRIADMKHAGVRFRYNHVHVHELRQLWASDTSKRASQFNSTVIEPMGCHLMRLSRDGIHSTMSESIPVSANVLVEDNFLFLVVKYPRLGRKYMGHGGSPEMLNSSSTLPRNVDVKKISHVYTTTDVNDYQTSQCQKPLLTLSAVLYYSDGSNHNAMADIDTSLNLCQQYAINLSSLTSSIFAGGQAHALRELIEYNFKTLKHLELGCAECHQEHVNILFTAALKCPQLEIFTFGTCSAAGTNEDPVALVATFMKQDASNTQLEIAIVEMASKSSSRTTSTWATNCKWDHKDLKIYYRDGPEVDNRAMIKFKHLLSLVEFPCQWLADETKFTSYLEPSRGPHSARPASYTPANSESEFTSAPEPSRGVDAPTQHLTSTPPRSYMKKMGFNVGRVIRRLLPK